MDASGRRVISHQIHSRKYLGTVASLDFPEGAALIAHANAAHVAATTARLRLIVQGFICAVADFASRQSRPASLVSSRIPFILLDWLLGTL